MAAGTQYSRVLYIGGTIVDNQTQDKYILRKKIGTAPFATVFKAQYMPKEKRSGRRRVALRTTFLALKVMPTKKHMECSELLGEAMYRSYRPGDHNNLIGFKTWFMHLGLFCLVMEYMDEGSLSYIVSKKFKNGMPEDCIAISLREALRGLSFVHHKGRLHKTFSAADIFVNRNPATIMLATKATLYRHDPSDDNFQNFDNVYEASTSAVPLNDNTTNWTAAPEAYNGRRDYTKAADIWLVGVTALELAYGGLHVSDREGFDAIITKITKKNKLPTHEKFVDVAKGVNLSKGKKVLHNIGMKLKALKISKDTKETVFSKEFEEMVLKCLDENPEKRPTADELLQCDFLRNSKDLKYFQQNVVNARIQISSA